MMLRFYRTPALPPPFEARIGEEARKRNLPVRNVETEFCFYVAVQNQLSDEEKDRLVWLLSETFEPEKFGEETFLAAPSVLEVGPRLNFETAYSTRATLICHVCGLDGITRMERSIRYGIDAVLSEKEARDFLSPLHDHMTEMWYRGPLTTFEAFVRPEPVRIIEVSTPFWKRNLRMFSKKCGLGWDDQDIEFVGRLFRDVEGRNSTDVELFGLGQRNSEHSRHQRFRNPWTIDGRKRERSLMNQLKAPLEKNPSNSVLAFCDNSSAIRGRAVIVLVSSDPTGPSRFRIETRVRHITTTAETHNHPTMWEPYEGEATKEGIFRDEECIGRGGEYGIGGDGQMIGNLHIPGYVLPWEEDGWRPSPLIATPLQIALRGTSGAFDYGNCYGHPITFGFFRTGGLTAGGEYRSWFKPVAYGVVAGSVDDAHLLKKEPKEGMLVVLIGGPAYRIGIGGGSGSSMMGGENEAGLDFNSVQRGDPAMGNLLHRVVRGCTDLLDKNPIMLIHDLGAGGLCNAGPESVEKVGARVSVEKIPSGDQSLSVLELDGNESQERNIAIIQADKWPIVEAIARREGCPIAPIGEVTGDGRYVLEDGRGKTTPVNIPLREALGELPPKNFTDNHHTIELSPLRLPRGLTLREALERVLRLPAVASKEWLTRKVDRSVTGLVAQQQCVGPNHLPVADCAIKADSYFGVTGSAHSLGEQPLVGLISPSAMVRLSITEALMNLAGAHVTDLTHVKGPGNWMLAAKIAGEGAWLHDAVDAFEAFMIELGIAEDGGKDSLSMAGVAISPESEKTLVAAPGAFVFSAAAPMADIRRKVTPDLRPGEILFFVNLSSGKCRLGGSALAQVYSQLGDEVPDADATSVKAAFTLVRELVRDGLITSYHDRCGDGGVIVTLLEMAFAGNTGLDLAFRGEAEAIPFFLNQEPGFVIACKPDAVPQVIERLTASGLSFQGIGFAVPRDTIEILLNGKVVLRDSMAELRDIWRETSFELDKFQTNPECVESVREHTKHLVTPPPYHLTFEPKTAPWQRPHKEKPKVAILRERGSNGDREMAGAFIAAAGFDVWDITMTDLCSGKVSLERCRGLIAVGGFSHADVFDAGKGWAGVVRMNDRVRRELDAFRVRPNTFTLGVCNGCQFMSLLGWVPGFDMKEVEQPRFIRNRSGRFESSFVSVKIMESPSVLLRGMAGSTLGIWVAHGEGRYHSSSPEVTQAILDQHLAPLCYVGPDNEPTEVYPWNPNGSPHGIAGLCSLDGRLLAMMPHPERTFLTWQWPWMPAEWAGFSESPWLKLFYNAYEWCRETR